MEIFTKKSIIQKISIVAVIVIIFNFIIPNVSHAKENFGGVLFTPVQTLVAVTGDAVMNVIGNLMIGKEGETVIHLKTSSNWGLLGAYAFSSAYITVLFPASFAQYSISKIMNDPTLNPYKLHMQMAKDIVDDGILPDKFDIPMYLVTPEKIFANSVPFLNANIFQESNANTAKTPVMQLKSVISTWYVAIRNLAIVIMLSVLLYVGIRMIISSAASSKAKYKQMLMDWIIGMLLIFFMHYIMSFSFMMVDSLTEAIKSNNQQLVVKLNLSKYKANASDEAEKALKKLGNLSDSESLDWNNVYIATDFTGYARILSQFEYSNSDGEDHIENNELSFMGYTIIYATLVIYTIMFTWKYLKRLVYIIFLVMIAPLIGLSYSLDKMNDGNAQGFNTWIREFLFTLLIQPFHLLLYTVLIGSAMAIAKDNMIYALVVLGFMLPAEKILRKFFGFDNKAPIASSAMGGAVGGAMAMQAINTITSATKKIGGAVNSKAGNSSANNSDGKVKMPSSISDDRKADIGQPDIIDTLASENPQNMLSNSDTAVIDSENNDDIENRRREQLEALNDDDEYPNFEQPYSHDEWDDINNQMYDDMYSGSNNNIRFANDNSEAESTGALGAINQNDIKLEIENSSNKDETKEKALKRPSKAKRVFKAAGSVIAPAAKQMGIATAKGVAKGAVATVGAATLGTIGIAAGLASEDYSNVVKYGLTGATAGATIANVGTKATIGQVSNGYRKSKEGISKMKENYYRADSKEAYQKYINNRADNAFRKNKEVQQLYKNEFGKEYKQAMEDAIEFRKHGVTDNEVIIKAMNAKVKGASKKRTSTERIAAAKLAKNVSNEKDIETIGTRLEQRGVRGEQLKVQKDMLRNIKGLV